MSNLCCENGVDKSFFSNGNNVNSKIDERITKLANNLDTYKHTDYLSSPDVKNALHNIHQDFTVVPIDKATGNILLLSWYCGRIRIK